MLIKSAISVIRITQSIMYVIISSDNNAYYSTCVNGVCVCLHIRLSNTTRLFQGWAEPVYAIIQRFVWIWFCVCICLHIGAHRRGPARHRLAWRASPSTASVFFIISKRFSHPNIFYEISDNLFQIWLISATVRLHAMYECSVIIRTALLNWF